MSKNNPLAGLVGYGDSDEESDDGGVSSSKTDAVSGQSTPVSIPGVPTAASAGAIHPAPIPHCPWSACYDEGSGFTYYWNQQTNAVTWEAPPEYLLALKIAQQQLNTSGSAEVSAEEWQLYQQALAEKQNTKVISKAPVVNKSAKKVESKSKNDKSKYYPKSTKRKNWSDDENETIELITSYHNSDSESNDESETPTKPKTQPPLPAPPVGKPPKLPKTVKKQKTKATPVEYGPPLPPNQNYTVPIGPELPPHLTESEPDEKSSKEVNKKSSHNGSPDVDDKSLLETLKNKAKILEKLGGEIPSDLQKIIQEESRSGTASPKVIEENSRDSKSIDNIDDLLEEIEKKELPKIKKAKVDIFDEESSAKSSPTSRDITPPLEVKTLFPSSKNIDTTVYPIVSLHENGKDVPEKKTNNVYLMDTETVDKPKKKLRISNSVLPERKPPEYTTKYSQFIEGFSGERTGLGFSRLTDEFENKNTVEDSKNTVNYGNGLMFTKGETLNEDTKDEELEALAESLKAKLVHLNELQQSQLSPVQEMLVQMQTLHTALAAGALGAGYWARWLRGGARALAALEAAAAPPGWTCLFLRSEGRYRYRRDADGLEQWEYPAVADTDMDISNTPPHPGIEARESPPPPPLPPSPPPPPPPPRVLTPPPPPRWADVPPPRWADVPPPGCEDQPPLPPEPKQALGDELQSFYADLASLDSPCAPRSPARAPRPPARAPRPPARAPRPPARAPAAPPAPPADTDKKEAKKEVKKKSKVKISSSMGMKHKTVSTLVAKWQQVAEEINSD